MQVWKQNSGDQDCVAVVAAMITGKTPQDFKATIKGESPYSDMDFCKYLFGEGFICGFGIGEEQLCDQIDVTDSNSEGQEFLLQQKELSPEFKINIEFKLKDFPAYVVVESQSDPTKEHAIYWDGKQIYDPNPLVPNGMNLNKYKILRWFPIINFKG